MVKNLRTILLNNSRRMYSNFKAQINNSIDTACYEDTVLLTKLITNEEISLCRRINYFPLFFIKYTTQRTMFQIKFEDLNITHILCHVLISFCQMRQF